MELESAAVEADDMGLPPPPEPRPQIISAAKSIATMSAKEHVLRDDGVERMARAIMMQVGDLISVRFAAIEGRLLPKQPLRPPLGAAGKTTKVQPKQQQQQQQQLQKQQQEQQPQQPSKRKSYAAAVTESPK